MDITKENLPVACKFSTVRERDMDLLFLEAIATDPGFANLLINKTDYAGKSCRIVDVELSRTDADDGESDITVKFECEGAIHAFLIEDKIDAVAMKNQHARYMKRGDIGIKNKEYQSYEVFIFCPEKYRINNVEAKKYEHFLSYEDCLRYFEKTDGAINRLRCQQICQAIERSKKISGTIMDADAITFNKKYQEYQRQNYPGLTIRTKETSNGWWQEYSTHYRDVYVVHKTQQGYVDLTFQGAVQKMLTLERVAVWFRTHSKFHIIAQQTNKSGSLRIEVPMLNVKEPFEKVSPECIKFCFDAIQELSDYANMLCDIVKISELSTSK